MPEEDEEEQEKEVKREGGDDDDDDDDEDEAESADVPTAEVAPAPKASPPREPAEVEFKPHASEPPLEVAVKVVYCPVCGLPPDFCQYGPSWEKCKPWCMEHFPHYYPELSGSSIDDAKKSAEEADEKSKEKLLPGGKKKRATSPRVTIRKLTRGGRKCVTSVAGLEGFGVKLDAVAKLFKKKFACGSSVVKGDAGAPDTVDIQGDFEDEVVDLIVEEFPEVPREKVQLLEGGTKKKGKAKG